LNVNSEVLPEIARYKAVRYIHEAHPPRLMNNVAQPQDIVQGNVAWEIIQGNAIFNGIEYKGEGQVIAIADTGFDRGDIRDVPPAFTGRVEKLYSLGRINNSDDPDSHGTHVCGTAVGVINSPQYGLIEAPASQAKLVMQSCYKDKHSILGGIPVGLTELFRVPYDDDGARIHSNSWGTSRRGIQDEYNSYAQSVDKFIWEHPDMVICFAAGNDGVCSNEAGQIAPSSISAEPAAKNCITVGASESRQPQITWDRGDQPYTYGSLCSKKFGKRPIYSDHMADNPEGMAAFSSRGPTANSRIKPDIVAPGTCILSTLSRLANPNGSYGISHDANLEFKSGTSMATPLVASCCAVIRECLIKNGCVAPTAALIKAILINGAVRLRGQYGPLEVKRWPNCDSGFGRINLANSVSLAANGQYGGYREATLDDSGEFLEIRITAPDTVPRSQLKVTLVYSDPPGAALQNNLNLIVSSCNVEMHGNKGHTIYRPGYDDRGDFDNDNNVEQVVWTEIISGEVTIKVLAYRVTRYKQPFACVWQFYSDEQREYLEHMRREFMERQERGLLLQGLF
jgi:serine protease AprX